ncbi:hypothetical protein Tco_0744806 [Tanacetum coccineum]
MVVYNKDEMKNDQPESERIKVATGIGNDERRFVLVDQQHANSLKLPPQQNGKHKVFRTEVSYRNIFCDDERYLDASAKLTRAKLDKRSGDVDLSKDKSGPESPPEFQRSWCVEGHLGDEGLCSGGTKLNSIFITAEVTFIKLKQPTSGDKGRGNGNPWGAYRTSPTNVKTPSPSPAFIKENIDVLRTMIKEHDQQAKMKATPRKLAYADSNKEAPAGSLSKNKEPTHLRRSRRLEDQSTTREKARRESSKSGRKRSGHQETSSDSEYEEGSDDDCEDLNSPYKRPKPTPFTQRITHFKYHKRAKLPRNIRVYEGNKDQEDHLGIFSAAAEQEEWQMPIWCKMFLQTLGGATRNWFDDLDPKSVDSFEELSQKFLEEFSQQKDMLKTPQKFTASKGDIMRAYKLSWTGSSLKVLT